MNGLLNSPVFFTSDLFMINILNEIKLIRFLDTEHIPLSSMIRLLSEFIDGQEMKNIRPYLQKKLHDHHICNMNLSKQCLNSSSQYCVKSSILLLHSHQKYILNDELIKSIEEADNVSDYIKLNNLQNKLRLTIYGNEFGITNLPYGNIPKKNTKFIAYILTSSIIIKRLQNRKSINSLMIWSVNDPKNWL